MIIFHEDGPRLPIPRAGGRDLSTHSGLTLMPPISICPHVTEISSM